MDQQYGDDFITITDEDGTEYELEVLARLEYEGSDYLALTPADAEDAEGRSGADKTARPCVTRIYAG